MSGSQNYMGSDWLTHGPATMQLYCIDKCVDAVEYMAYLTGGTRFSLAPSIDVPPLVLPS